MQFDESQVNPLVQGHKAEQKEPKFVDDGHLESKNIQLPLIISKNEFTCKFQYFQNL